MHCTVCGEEIVEGSKFCSKCGAKIGDSVEYGSIQEKKLNVKNNEFFAGYNSVIQKFFSKTPFSIFEGCKEKTTFEYLLFAGIYVLLFAIVMGINMNQLTNFTLGKVISTVSSNIGYSIPTQEFSPSNSKFGSLLLMAMAVMLLEVIGCLVITEEYKRNVNGLICSINIVSLSYIPVIIGLLVNLIIGFLYAPITVAITICCYMLHLGLMYYGMKSVVENTDTMIWLFTALMLIISIIGVLMAVHGIEQAVDTLMKSLMQFVKEKASGLLDIF